MPSGPASQRCCWTRVTSGMFRLERISQHSTRHWLSCWLRLRLWCAPDPYLTHSLSKQLSGAVRLVLGRHTRVAARRASQVACSASGASSSTAHATSSAAGCHRGCGAPLTLIILTHIQKPIFSLLEQSNAFWASRPEVLLDVRHPSGTSRFRRISQHSTRRRLSCWLSLRLWCVPDLMLGQLTH